MNLQFGQAHLIVVAAAMAGMLQLARGRRLAGAALLGFATATKVFPGLLLVHLAVRRRWRDLAATLAALAALIGLAALVLGPPTLTAFVTEHVPRMASGEAFSNTEENPDNHALYGLAFKLATLGVDGAGRELAATLAWIWGAIALVLTALGSRGRAEPAREAVVWLGILCLATLRSPFAPMYSAVGTLWLLAIAIGAARPRRWLTAAVAASWLLLQGFPPIFSSAHNALASFPSQLATIAIAVAAVWPRRGA
jgi:alpha-1,2-mannosyltransferase